MGDMRTVIDRAIANLREGGYLRPFGPTRGSRVEAIMWAVWEASYTDGYNDGWEDASDEEEDASDEQPGD